MLATKRYHRFVREGYDEGVRDGWVNAYHTKVKVIMWHARPQKDHKIIITNGDRFLIELLVCEAACESAQEAEAIATAFNNAGITESDPKNVYGHLIGITLVQKGLLDKDEAAEVVDKMKKIDFNGSVTVRKQDNR